jgi:hypothetical protein
MLVGGVRIVWISNGKTSPTKLWHFGGKRVLVLCSKLSVDRARHFRIQMKIFFFYRKQNKEIVEENSFPAVISAPLHNANHNRVLCNARKRNSTPTPCRVSKSPRGFQVHGQHGANAFLGSKIGFLSSVSRPARESSSEQDCAI